MMDSAKKMLRKDKRRFYTDLKYQKRKKKNGAQAIFETKAKQIPRLMKYTNSLIQETQITKAGKIKRNPHLNT